MGLSDYLGKFWATSEPMFGIIMVICFTSVLRIHQNLSFLLIDRVTVAALACCIAWGLVDGIFYAWEAHYLQRRKNDLIRLVKQDHTGNGASRVNEEMDDTLLVYLDQEDRDQVVDKISKKLSREEPEGVPIVEDIATVGGSLFLVVGPAIVVLLPFYVFPDVSSALFISNILAITMFFVLGYVRNESTVLLKRIRTGFLTALLGVIITFVTLVLGG